jgi:hypothetical protein
MGSYLEKSKETVKTIMKNIRARVAESEISIKFGFVAYRDHPP